MLRSPLYNAYRKSIRRKRKSAVQLTPQHEFTSAPYPAESFLSQFSALCTITGEAQPSIERSLKNVEMLCEERIQYYQGLYDFLTREENHPGEHNELFNSLMPPQLEGMTLSEPSLNYLKSTVVKQIPDGDLARYRNILNLIQRNPNNLSKTELAFEIREELLQQGALEIHRRKGMPVAEAIDEVLYYNEGAAFFNDNENVLSRLFANYHDSRANLIINIQPFYQQLLKRFYQSVKLAQPIMTSTDKHALSCSEESKQLNGKMVSIQSALSQLSSHSRTRVAELQTRAERLRFIKLYRLQTRIMNFENEIQQLKSTIEAHAAQRIKASSTLAPKTSSPSSKALHSSIVPVAHAAPRLATAKAQPLLSKEMSLMQTTSSTEAPPLFPSSSTSISSDELTPLPIAEMRDMAPPISHSSPMHTMPGVAPRRSRPINENKRFPRPQTHSSPSSLIERIACDLAPHKDLFVSLFEKKTPHHKIRFSALERLVRASGGQVKAIDGSRRRIMLINTWTCVLIPQLKKFGGVHKPHATTHNKCAAFTVEQFREAFIRAGIQPHTLWPSEYTAGNEPKRETQKRHRASRG